MRPLKSSSRIAFTLYTLYIQINLLMIFNSNLAKLAKVRLKDATATRAARSFQRARVYISAE